MKETHILLVRHPETEANVAGRFVGRGDSPFTRTGRQQLRRTPAKVARFAPDTLWSSPLRRTLTLAERAGALAHLTVQCDERLVELDFGQAEGMRYEDIAEAGLPFNYRDGEQPVAPDGESRGDLERRAAAFLDEVVARGGRHAVVTHGGVFRASLVHLLGLSTSDIWAFHIHNAQLAYLRVSDGHGMLEEYRQG